jgi:hypothetical protein
VRTIGSALAFGVAAIDGALDSWTRCASGSKAVILLFIGGIETFAVFVISLMGAKFLAPQFVVVFHLKMMS